MRNRNAIFLGEFRGRREWTREAILKRESSSWGKGGGGGGINLGFGVEILGG